jgi:predicted metal-dependent HD superfamily phosphohydrolase
MSLVTLERWQAVCKTCGFAGRPQEYRRVIRGWSSWGRRYHTFGHLEACLKEFDAARHLATYPGEVELALWFHDVVYSTRRSDNEARSAELAREIMAIGRAPAIAIERVKAAIMATRHQEEPLTEDATLVVDVDLSILGQPPDVYEEFERNVRREYWWVPRRRFVAARRAILESFFKRPSIYGHAEFKTRYESAARVNLEAAIARLKS